MCQWLDDYLSCVIAGIPLYPVWTGYSLLALKFWDSVVATRVWEDKSGNSVVDELD